MHSTNQYKNADSLRELINDTKIFTQTVITFTILYAVFQSLSHIPGSEAFFFIFLVVVVFAGLIKYDLILLGVPIILLQHTTPLGLHSDEFRNWIYGDFLVPISMVHIFTICAGMYLFYYMLTNKKIRLEPNLVNLAILLSLAIVFSFPIKNMTIFLGDLRLVVTLVIYTYYVTQVLNKKDNILLGFFILTVPLGVSMGNLLLLMLSMPINIDLFNYISSTPGYIIVVLIGMSLLCIINDGISQIVLFTYMFNSIAYVSGILLQFVGAGSGATTLLIIVASTTIFSIKTAAYKKRYAVGILSILVITTFGYLFLYYNTSTNLPLEFLVFKIVSLFTFDLSEIGRSPAIRVIELLNILSEMSNDIVILLFGNGLGGYFTDAYVPFSDHVRLGNDSFPLPWRQSGTYYNAHTGIGWILLKHGFIGLVIISYLLINMLKNYITGNFYVSVLSMVVLFTTTLFYGFRTKNLMIIGVCAGLLISFSSSVS